MEHKVTIKDALISYDVIRRKVKDPRLEFKKGRLRLILPEDYPDHESIIHRHRRWIYNRHCRAQGMLAQAREMQLVPDRADGEFRLLVNNIICRISKELGVAPQAVRFRKMRTKWGCCNSKGRLGFNTHIKYLPEDLIEYIVFHEMVHLIELNHGPAFQSYIRARFSDHRDYDRKLSSCWFLIQNHVDCSVLAQDSESPCKAPVHALGEYVDH